MSEEKFSKCEERGRKKNISVEFRVFEKKGIGRKILKEKKNQSVSWGKIKIFVVSKES